MPPAKRKRRTTHRGNAAGSAESRGRTGRPPTAEERKQATRGRGRAVRAPSWNSAAGKAGLMSVLLFVLTRIGLFGGDVPFSQSILLAVFAMVLYTPLAYLTDKWVYNRQMRREAQAPGP